MLEAARVLRAMGEELNVLVTGGHLDPPDDLRCPFGVKCCGCQGRRS